MSVCRRIVGLVASVSLALAAARPTHAQGVLGSVFPEQRRMEIRHPSQLPIARLPDVPAPSTVSTPQADREPLYLSLDDAIRTALANSEVVRVLTGSGAGSSGSTIYDPAITNTDIDQARASFDPGLQVLNTFDRNEIPGVSGTPPAIGGYRDDRYSMRLGASKKTITGGTASLGVNTDRVLSTRGSELNPQVTSSVDLSFEQPLLKGAGRRANLAPIEIARIDTERSFYQLKQSVQQLVRGVIESYWALVFARTDVWARRQQVKQGQWAFDFADARFRHELGNAGDRAQARSSLASFRANLITSEATVLRREAALRNILGLPPSDHTRIVPVTPPSMGWTGIEWDTILRTAEQYRPDLIELKLVIEADRHQLLAAGNQALPEVNASALYRWNGLSGRATDDRWLSTDAGQFTGWQFGIDVSLPLGLRQSRAALRQRELILMRDRANLEQALHNATHLLAENYRNLTQYYEQYLAFKETREAARTNLDAQSARWAADLAIYLNVLQAITSWGDAVDSEARSLLEYNTELASLQEQMGTILEEHGVQFTEERYGSIGPLGRLFPRRPYPGNCGPCPSEDHYQSTSEPAENVFNLDEPVIPHRGDLDRRRLPAPGLNLQPERLMQPVPDAEGLSLPVPE